jgi:tetratricopeptide (TPR) repeat protein
MQAERYAGTDPEQALQWRPDHPQALLVLAERQLAQGKFAEAQASARQLLAHEPLQGVAFRVLAEAAESEGRLADAFRLYLVAEKRAPRDLQTRAWLTQRYLERGDFAGALGQVDRILRMAPQRARSINPVLAQLAQDPAFADALAARLRQGPPWRAGLLNALRDPKTGNPVAVGHVMQALQNQGGLTPEEYTHWLDSLMMQGRWGEAYARWAGKLPKAEGRLPLVYNGNFAQPPSDVGFDWRLRRVPGVMLQFEPDSGAGGQVVYLHFLDRRVPSAGLEQALLLSPGTYRLAVRMRAQSLRSEMGMQWNVDCSGPAGVVARTDGAEGSFAWRTFEAEVTIPPTGCPGQWLRLVNPVPSGAAQHVAGELWLDDVTITRQR